MGARVSGAVSELQAEHEAWMAAQLAKVEHALRAWVAPGDIENSMATQENTTQDLAPVLSQAMRYAVLDGGKRLRPLLVLAAAEAVEATAEKASRAALRAACAVELIHAYSLVHDDMPCMDNDVLRRGKPTVHVKFGEAQALLAGDALQALAFELLTPGPDVVDVAVQAGLCRLLALSAGCHGMAGGQAIDLASVGKLLTIDELQTMHRLKTGALLQASVLMGAACGDVAAKTSSTALAGLQEYGAAIGLAFQVVDDILDVTADTATLGKTAGKDAEQDKPTFVALLGLEKSIRYADKLLEQALAALARTGLKNTQALRSLAHMVVNRTT
jgi:farnesyl diphosphate synthase